MILFKQYNNLPNFLERFTLIQVGRLHLRIHKILDKDGTPFLHTHPFHYISIIMSGGYEEWHIQGKNLKKTIHRPGSIIFRLAKTPHRIHEVNPNCKTLFITWKIEGWTLKTHPEIKIPKEYKTPKEKGLYKRKIQGVDMCAKFDGFWYKEKSSKEEAEASTTPSVYQCGDWQDL